MPSEALRVIVRLVQNPWSHMVPDGDLFELLHELGIETAVRIQERYDRNEYESAKLAIVLLDPTAPSSRPSEDCVIAIILIGDGAEQNITNAAGKAFAQRDKGINIGAMVYAHKHLLRDGSFRYGHGFCVDGTPGGASGLREDEDRYEGTIFAAGLNYRIYAIIAHWEEQNPDGKWYCNKDLPDERFRVAGLAYIVDNAGDTEVFARI